MKCNLRFANLSGILGLFDMVSKDRLFILSFHSLVFIIIFYPYFFKFWNSLFLKFWKSRSVKEEKEKRKT